MTSRAYVVRARATPLPLQDALTVIGAIACVLAAAVLYLCFTAMALVDDDEVLLGRARPPHVTVATFPVLGPDPTTRA